MVSVIAGVGCLDQVLRVRGVPVPAGPFLGQHGVLDVSAPTERGGVVVWAFDGGARDHN